MDERIQSVARERETECLVESRALQLRLGPLRNLNWATVIAPAVLTAIGGAAIISALENAAVKIFIGAGTLVGSLLVIVHKALNCDAYQADAKRLSGEYHALATEYRTIHQVGPADSEARLLALDERLARLRKTYLNLPEKYRKRAMKAAHS